jgi:hypothetical protein
VPPVSLERTLQVSIGEDRKSRSSDCFFVLASLSSYRCDLTFAYDVISILHVLFVFNKKRKKKRKRGSLRSRVSLSQGMSAISCILSGLLVC